MLKKLLHKVKNYFVDKRKNNLLCMSTSVMGFECIEVKGDPAHDTVLRVKLHSTVFIHISPQFYDVTPLTHCTIYYEGGSRIISLEITDVFTEFDGRKRYLHILGINLSPSFVENIETIEDLEDLEDEDDY